MDALPPEILHQIFIKLTLVQKQECMYVCPQWRDLIRERSLFHSVYIPNRHVYNKFVNLVQREPALQTQVEYIKVCHGQNNFCNTIWLLDLFPRLRQIKLAYSPISPIIMATKEFDENTRESYITHLRDYERCTLTELLAINQCQRLVSLSLKLVTYVNIPEKILDLLKHMPSLKHLSLESIWVTMSNCETISANVPSLESLELHSAIAASSSSETPKFIEPATSLKKFTVNLSALDNTVYQIDWPAYILKKYPSLEHLEFSADAMASTEHVRQFYERGFTPLIQVLGRKLKSLGLLNLGACEDDNVVKHLSNLGPRLNTLKIRSLGGADTIARALGQTHQASSIEHLVIKELYPSSFSWLNSIVKLNKFEMYVSKWLENSDLHMELHDIFQHLPQTVKSAVVHLCQAKATLSETPLQTSIEQLEIATSNPVIGIDDLISSCFPYLNRLILHNCFQHNAIVKLQRYRLSYLEIKHYSSVSFTVGKKTYYYILRSERKTKYIRTYAPLSEEYSPVLLDAVKSEEFLYIICRSVETFVLNDAPVSFLPVPLDQLKEDDESKQKNMFSKLYNIMR
ncbi:hypothetical protein K501DRAFT_334421 [Backusella circina FSU 941]|nr:hypothetical protein K501DRAFT_334421 [Backusella circina FSU 941]